MAAPRKKQEPPALKLVRVRSKDAKGVHDRLIAKLLRKAHQVAGPPRLRKFAFELRSAKGKPFGGIYGSSYWGWLYIEQFWLPEELRGKGWGRVLLEKAEEVARARACLGVGLFTRSWHNRGFYRHLGFKKLGQLDDSPKGSSTYWLAKRF